MAGVKKEKIPWRCLKHFNRTQRRQESRTNRKKDSKKCPEAKCR